MGGCLEFEAFYEAQYQRVFKAIYLSSGERELAHDLTQEAFKLAFARWQRLSPHDWAGGWVMTTALNLLRKQRRGHHDVLFDPSRHDSEVRGTVSDHDLVVAIRSLPHRQRTAVLLYYLADMPIHDVAEAMNVADGTVKALLSQARANLEKRLGRDC